MAPRFDACRRVARVLLFGVLALAVGACDGAASQSAVSGQHTSASRQGPSAMSASSTAPTQPIVDGCAQARPITSEFPGPDDAVIGPLSYGGLQSYRGAPVDEANRNGGYYYKSGAQLRPGLSVTVSIDGPAAGYAAIVTEGGPDRGSRSVTYRSCDHCGATGSWWVGGFVLYGRRSACVPLKVTSPAAATAHRAVVSLGAGTCA